MRPAEETAFEQRRKPVQKLPRWKRADGPHGGGGLARRGKRSEIIQKAGSLANEECVL